MSGGTDTVTQKSGPPEWMIPYVQKGMDFAGQVASQPYRPYEGSRVADLNPVQYGTLDATANRALMGNQATNVAQGEVAKTAGGGYLGQGYAANPYFGSNPYLSQAIDQASGDTIRNYERVVQPQLTALDARSGSFGNSGVNQVTGQAMGDLSRNLSGIASDMRFKDYTTQQGLGESAANRMQQAFESERGRQMQAAGLAPAYANLDYTDLSKLGGVGDTLQNQSQRLLDDQYSRFREATDYSQQQLNTLLKGLGINAGSVSSSEQPGVSPAAGALGGAATGGALGSTLGGAANGATWGPYGALAGAALGATGASK